MTLEVIPPRGNKEDKVKAGQQSANTSPSLPANLTPDNLELGDTRAWLRDARREAAARELHQLGDADNASDMLAEDFAQATDAANFLIADIDNRPEMRAFVDAVIGATMGDAEFVEITDEELAKRLGRSTKTVQTYRNKFREIDAHGILIEIKDNWRDPLTGASHSHAYKCKITALATEAMQDARTSPHWTRGAEGRSKALEDAAARVALGATLGALRKPKRRKEPTDAEVMTRKLRQATNAVLAAANRRGMVRNPDDAELWDLRQAHVAALKEFDEVCGFDTSISTQDSYIRSMERGQVEGQVERGQVEGQVERGQVEKTSTQNDSMKLTTYENGETQPAPVSPAPVAVEMAERAVEACGVEQYQLTILDDAAPKGDVAGFETPTRAELAAWMPDLLKDCGARRRSLIMRPVASNFIQADDLSRATVERLQPFAFMTVETSAGNYQAWIALPRDVETDERSALRRRLLDGVGADRGASGAMRWPGSINFKKGRNQFMVRLVSSNPGRVATVAELEAANLLAPVPPSLRLAPPSKPRANRAPVQWPDYQRCVTEAKRRDDGSVDLSSADIKWCILALDRGWQSSEVELKLAELRDKARRRPDYARRTVAQAARKVNSRA